MRRKLRLVEERTENRSDLPDLRGFQDPELFQRTGILSFLDIESCDNGFLQEICNAYHLTQTSHALGQNKVRLKPQNSACGNHKQEALHVFTAALEIHKKFPTTHCTVFQISELRVLLRERIKEETHAESAEIQDHLKTNRLPQSSFIIDQGISQAIHEAGLSQRHTDQNWHSLDASELSFAINEMKQASEKGKQVHKYA
jgi:hypothetical protein